MIRLTPTGSKVILKLIEVKEEVKGRIIIPATAQGEQKHLGEIIAIGPDVKFLSKGQIVLYGKQLGLAHKWDDGTYLAVEELDVLAIVENDV